MSLRKEEEQSPSLEMALQQEGWGATAFFTTSTTHFVASETNDMHRKKENFSVRYGSVGAAAVWAAAAAGATMAMQTRSRRANFVADECCSDFAAAIVLRNLSVKVQRRIWMREKRSCVRFLGESCGLWRFLYGGGYGVGKRLVSLWPDETAILLNVNCYFSFWVTKFKFRRSYRLVYWPLLPLLLYIIHTPINSCLY